MSENRSFWFRLLVLSPVAFVLLFNSCSCERPPRVDHIEVDINLIPFYEDLFSINPDSFHLELDRLKKTYGKYLEAYSLGVIGAGHPDDSDYVENMRFFLDYEPNQEVLDTVRHVFHDKDALKRELTKAFQYYLYYFPDEPVPDIYLHISGFNQNMVVDSTWLSISVEQYLGADCIFYEWLSVPMYLRRTKATEKVVPDVMKAIAMSRYLYNDSIDDLANQMIYNGKLLWFVKHMVPDIPDTLLFDFSKEEMAWVKGFEKDMWAVVVEQKHLFSTDRMTLQRYIGKSPFTFFFGQDSPGRTGHYIGYRIIQSFMRRNPDVTLRELMEMDNGHEIFAAARYRP
ncbi:gliding motility lipoprotein GldB [Alkalitalea saponilacus]|uniref:Gliding motility-associated lipoprotein GldB n=1 Tax=Alkalitalea saponilacus TaxID=889453 RepID=A0A1T5HF77_9BACT|nr:gliding motility protein GldB [Alkalitalea saponilacus]ASB48089.1 gliding motility protein GldB [Alkalitalea saponilacus]SKC19294.1 hypothetical protein SAMN03080601_02264 [Alkalitalea saponilacus]